jgi:hypothetical protein
VIPIVTTTTCALAIVNDLLGTAKVEREGQIIKVGSP